jgi:hypothetical protein
MDVEQRDHGDWGRVIRGSHYGVMVAVVMLVAGHLHSIREL